MKRATVLASVMAASLLIASPSQAAIIRIDIAGDVTTADPTAPAMQAIGPFTAQITLNTLSPDQGALGTRIAFFNLSGVPRPLLSYIVDGVEFVVPTQETAEVAYIRQTTRDILAIDTQGNDPGEWDIISGGILPLDFFGPGPYSLDQFLGMTNADFTSPINVEILSDTDFAEGVVTSLSVSVVPEPSLLSLALGALLGSGLVRRLHGLHRRR